MLKDVYITCRDALKQGGIENAAFEAQCMLEHLTGYSRAALLAHGEEPFDRQDALDHMIRRRLDREPLQYIFGKWTFCGIELAVGEGVLIPRDDTEVVLRLCMDFLKSKPNAQYIDLCAGSGAIAIALAQLSHADVTAIELSEQAYAYLKQNTKNTSVTPVRGDIFTCHTDVPDAGTDLIVSNPPYIPSAELPSLQTEVRFEPAIALDGGTDGTDFYKTIIRCWSSKLKPGGALAFELGEQQADMVRDMMKTAGFGNIRTEKDFGGTQRAIIGTML